jgi:hypothetical protein
MMLRYFKLVYLAAALIVTSCSSITGSHGVIQNRDTDYLKARSIPPITVPINFGSSTIQAHYPVPEKDYPESAQNVDLTPPELSQPVATPKPKPVQPYRTAENTTTPADNTQQQQTQNFYFDSHTRSTTNGAGKPMASVLNSILPANKPTVAETTPAPTTKPAQPQKMAQATTAPTENKPAETSNPQPENHPGIYYDRFTKR